MTATVHPYSAKDLQDVHANLPRGYVIVDHTVYEDGRPGYRTINVTREGRYLGHLSEYPTVTPRFRFQPEFAVPYGEIHEVVQSLTFVGVAVDDPVQDPTA